MSILSRPYFHDETKAFEHLERLLWPDGAICPHCGIVGTATKLCGEAHRLGVWKCNERECRKQFTAKVGTVFEHGRMPLHKMLQAVYLMCSSKKGVSAHQLHRTLEITYKSAWFLAHRIREAMRHGKLGPMGGQNEVVEADDTVIGGKAKNRAFKPEPKKHAVVALVQRDGSVRSFHVADVTAATLKPVLKAHIDRASYLMTDEAKAFAKAGKGFRHGTVNHSADEYVRAYFWHTNTVEGYFSLLKRGINGVYHHVSEAHLHRYLSEFDFRYSNRAALGIEDDGRTTRALKGIVGKRLTYRRTDQVATA